jgi:hypothetical protein
MKVLTQGQKDAAFKVAYPKLIALAEQYAKQVNIPFINVQAMVDEKLHSQEAKDQLAEFINEVGEAIENA